MTRSSQIVSSKMEPKIKTTPIAVIGMGSIFPEARSTQQYWDNILRKIDTITDVPASRWSIADYYDADPTVADKTYCKRGAFIPDIDFDPMEFGLPPNILEVTDVSQLLGLVLAKDALDDAGYGEGRAFNRELTGCVLGFVGTSSKLFTPLMNRLQYPVWEKVLTSAGVSQGDTQKIIEKMKLAYVNWEENSFPGAIGNVVAGRICNRFDLGGMNCVVDAACASSLAAIKMAVGELIEGRADMMLTGGIDTDNSINSYMCFSKTPAFTRKENVRPFDAESGGMMVGEGMGMVVLKRLEDAERDGDRVYAVIKAIGTSSDGRYKSIYAPRPAGQTRAMRRAYEEAGFSPATVGLIEAHGTGTMAGDPAEFEGLREAFGENNPRKQHIALGSVKSQIGHTKAAAGVASLIKTSLALYHKILPPTINVSKPHPKLGIEESPFYINTEARPWIRAKNAAPRRAGVSSFGFGGTNYHVVLEEHTAEQTGAYRRITVAQPVLLSAPDPAQLLTACREALASLHGEMAGVNFANLVKNSQTLQVPLSASRVGFVAETAEEAAQFLQICVETLSARPGEESWEHPKGIFFRKSGLETDGKLVALFSGQGSQYLEMGRDLANNFPAMREVFGEMDALFVQDGLEPISSRVYPNPVFDASAREQLSEILTHTEHAQPAIGSMSVGLYRLLEQAGFQPDFVAGHSFGELTALWAAGVVSEADYYQLAKARGKAMAPPDDAGFDAGTMVAVKGDVEKVREALKSDPDVTLANLNSNDQVVIAGSKPVMARAQQTLNGLGFKTIPLPVSAAFHTPLVGHAQKPFAKAIQAARFKKPKTRVYSNSTGLAHADDPKSIQALLAEHILKPVLFRDEIENIYAAGGTIFVEFGPKNVLTNLVSSILAGRPHLAVALNPNAKKDSDRQLREAVIALRVAGLPLSGFDPYAAEYKVTAPRKHSPVTVKLNGGYYVSEKTRNAFEKALNDGFTITMKQATPAVTPQVNAVSAPAHVEPVLETTAAPMKNTSEETPVRSTADAQQIEHVLAEYQARQSEALGLHEQYLRMEEEYARAFAQMTGLQSELVARISAAPGETQAVLPLFESLERSMTRFHDHQAETLRVHQRYMETQEQYSQTLLQGMNGAALAVSTRQAAPAQSAAPVRSAPAATAVPAATVAAPSQAPHLVSSSAPTNGNGAGKAAAQPVVAEPKPVVQTTAPVSAVPAAVPTVMKNAPDAALLKNALLAIVSEKTGYPVETLELDMDMEADLGIDSIKRVEILGAMQTQFPELPQIEPTLLAEMRTLGQIVDQFNLSVAQPAAAPAQSSAANPEESAATATSVVTATTVATATDITVDAAAVTQALLAIVSEKTGYPVETLELDMDMEADLGIDSIKRVEILGAMQTQFPELPQVEATALAEMRTLGQITQAMGSNIIAPPVETAVSPQSMTAPVMAQNIPQISAAKVDVVSAALLAIVSEKTGYPAETLELDMDMEADLGIDSIKRVEIMGALQTQFPELPQVDPAEMAELRTLGQITNSLSRAAVAAPSQEVTGQSPFEFGGVEALPVNDVFYPGIEQGVVVRRLLPPPDSMAFTLPKGHVCLVTDDGTAITAELVQALLDKDWPVVVLRLPETPGTNRLVLPAGAASLTLEDFSETGLETMLARSAEQFGPAAVFIHLETPGHGHSAEGRSPDTEKEMVKLIFLAAKHLKNSLNAAADAGRAAFMVVTRLDGAFGLGDEDDFAPVSGGLFGLVKTLNLEWEAVFCRAIDLSPALENEQAVHCILAELHDPNRLIAEVGYTRNERSTLAIASVPVTGVLK